MDWITQGRFVRWLLIVLLAGNVLMVCIIWLLAARAREPQRGEPEPRSSESAALMKKVLGLDEAQTKQVEAVLAARREQSKSYDDRLTGLKTRLARELFSDHPDTAVAVSIAKEIGEVQSEIEMMRFRRFSDLVALCTSEQRKKLEPVVMEVFGRRPPASDDVEKTPPHEKVEEHPPRGVNPAGVRREDTPPSPGGKSGPLSIDEKLARYAQALGLTADQTRRVRAVLERAEGEGQELREKENPDRAIVDAEKERIREEEENGIRHILTPGQVSEFERLLSQRKQ